MASTPCRSHSPPGYIHIYQTLISFRLWMKTTEEGKWYQWNHTESHGVFLLIIRNVRNFIYHLMLAQS